jgi:hypothetical protein
MNENKKGVRAMTKTTKTKNPIAAAHQKHGGSKSGSHTDKSKTIPRKEKHKGQQEYAESYGAHLAQQLAEATVNSQLINSLVTKILATEARRVTNAPIEQLLAPVMNQYGLTLQQIDSMVPGGLKKAAGQYGVMVKGMAEEYDDGKNVPNVSVDLWQHEYQKAVQAVKLAKTQQEYEVASERASKIKELLAGKGIKVGPVLDHEMAEGGTPFASHTAYKQAKEKAVKDFDDVMKGTPDDEAKSREFYKKRAEAPRNRHDEYDEGVSETEGEPEGLPHLTKELAGHIAQQIETDGADAIVKSVTWGDGAADELVQFIKKALEKVSGGMKEDSALTQYRKRSAQSDADFAKREAERKKNPGAGMEKRIDDLAQRYKTKEGWTHDSLADELFEHERTYEEQLQSRLNKSLGK